MIKSTESPTSAILYYRVSPRPKLDDSESIPAQTRACHEYCKKQGYTIAAEYSDIGRSGSDSDRPGLWDAIAALRRGYVLVARWQSRFARDVYISEVIDRTVRKTGARIEVVEGSTGGDDPQSTLIRQVFNAFSEYERKITASRTKHAMLRHQEQGRRMSDRLPYGRRASADITVTNADGSEKIIRMVEDDQEEQQNILRICELHRSGIGLRAIGRQMESAGIRYRTRQRWHHNSVRAVLQRAGLLEGR